MRALLIVCFLVAFQSGCGGGGGSTPTSTPPPAPIIVAPPTGLSVTEGPGAKEITLLWTPSTSNVNGYILEGRIGSEPFTALNSTTNLIPPTATGVYITFSDTAPDNTDYGFRMKASSGGVASDYSNEAVYHRPLGGPSFINASFIEVTARIAVRWSANSVTADGCKLERNQIGIDGNFEGSWITLPTPPGVQSAYDDLDIHEGTTYVYRVTNLAGKLSSPSSGNSNFVAIPLLAPINLTASTVAGGIQLSWQNLSQAATTVTIRRGGGPLGYGLSDLVVLSPNVGAFLDANPPVGYYYYKVFASKGSEQSWSLPATGVVPNPPGTPNLTQANLNLPLSIDACIQPNGNWAFANGIPFGVLSNNDPWQAYIPNDAFLWSFPVIRMDASGWPHAVYLVRDIGNPENKRLTHIWSDAAGWHTEVIGQTNHVATDVNHGFIFDLDATGTPHVLLDHSDASHPYGTATATLSYVHKVAGSWVSDSLASLHPEVFNIGTYHIRLDKNNKPHVLIGNSSSIIEYVPDGQAGWNSDVLPTGPVDAGSNGWMDGLFIDGESGTVFFQRGGGGVGALQKVGGVWQPSVLLGYGMAVDLSMCTQVAMSSDRTRTVVFMNSYVGLKLFEWNGSIWKETLLAPPADALSAWIRFGFDGANKAHSLVKTDQPGYIEYHE